MVRVRVSFEKPGTGTERVRVKNETLVRKRDGYVMIFKSKYGNGTGTEKSQNWSTGTESVHFSVFRTMIRGSKKSFSGLFQSCFGVV